MTFHWAIVAETAGLAVLIGAIAALWWRGHREELRGQPGWGAILAGLVALSLGTLVDLIAEIRGEFLPTWLGGDVTETLLRDLVLPGAGVLLLTIGLLRWIPLPVRLEETRRELARANERLEERVEEATRDLAERKEQLELAVGTTDMVLSALDPDGVFTLSDGSGLRRLGLEPGEVVGEDIRDVYADHPGILDAFDEALEGEPVRFEAEVAGTFWESQFVPRVDGDGNVEAVAGVSVDVTERVEAERALAESQELFETIAENLPAVLYKTGASASEIEYVSPAAEEILGLEPYEMVEDPGSILGVVAPEDRDEMAANLSGPPTTEPVEFRIDHPSKGRRWVRATTYPIGDVDGDPDGAVGVAFDVTEERRMQALQDEADRMSLELETAREMDAFKDQFLNMAAHELATPLTPLRFQLDALREGVVGEPSDEQVEALTVADRAVDRLEHLIGNLVDATSLRAGGLDLAPEPGELAAIVAEAIETADRLYAGQLETDSELEAPVEMVLDVDRVERAVTNLVLEAAAHGDPEAPVLVRLEADEEAAHLRIEVTTSADVDASTLRAPFEPLERLDEHERGEVEGTGLGPFVAKGVVEAHEGTLDALCEDAQLRFVVELPLAGIDRGSSASGDRNGENG